MLLKVNQKEFEILKEGVLQAWLDWNVDVMQFPERNVVKYHERKEAIESLLNKLLPQEEV